jgi:hypothetical protein
VPTARKRPPVSEQVDWFVVSTQKAVLQQTPDFTKFSKVALDRAKFCMCIWSHSETDNVLTGPYQHIYIHISAFGIAENGVQRTSILKCLREGYPTGLVQQPTVHRGSVECNSFAQLKGHVVKTLKTIL